ncbi:MAG: histidine phosphatase family protein [Bellilinea sp.]
MQLYFIRHAQSENNQKWSDSGSSLGRFADPGITDLGKRQAQALAEFIANRQLVTAASPYDETNAGGIGLTHLYTSLMARAVLTANTVAEKIDLPLVGLEDAHEGGGVYLEDEKSGELNGQPGKTPEELKSLSDRLVLPELNPNGWWNRPFEVREERVARARRLLAYLLEQHGGTGDKIALFSHAAFFNYFVAAVFELDQRPPVWVYLNNTGVSRFDFNGEENALVYSNRTEHLTPNLLS